MTDQVPTDVQATDQEQHIPEGPLRAAAQTAVSGWHVTYQPKGKGGFAKRVEAARDALDILYAELEGLPADPSAGPDPLLEIRENPRLLRGVVLEAASIRRKVQRLPRILVENGEEETRVIALAAVYLDAAHSVWSTDAFRIFMDEAQRTDPLELKELWALPTMLKFLLLEWTLTQASARLHAPDSTAAGSAEILRTRIKSMRESSYAGWPVLIEELVAFEAILRKDPAQTYARMDFDSREQYRKRVSEIARHAEATESQVASAAVAMARGAQQESSTDERLHLRRMHVGYYLVDKGFTDLSRRVGKNFPLRTEGVALKFRADAFNVFNHPNFSLPCTDITNVSCLFGNISSTEGTGINNDGDAQRVLQLALRLEF